MNKFREAEDSWCDLQTEEAEKKSDRQLIGNYFSSVHMRFISHGYKTQCCNHTHFCFYAKACKNGRKQFQMGFLILCLRQCRITKMFPVQVEASYAFLLSGCFSAL